MSERITTRSIVLGRVAYGESDWIVTFFSRDAGRMSGIARAGRKSLKRFGSGLEPGAVTALTYFARPHSNLVNLEGSHVVFSTTGMMSSLERIEALAKAIRLATAFLREHQVAPEKFDLMEGYLEFISQSDPTEAQRLGFELKWLALAGYEPALNHCGSCGAEIKGDAAFSPAQGGAVCNACSRGERAAVVLSSPTRETMVEMLARPMEAHRQLHDGRAVAALVERYTEHILGHPLWPRG
jgi:DNA repair protein RecO (recombination protein O)